MNQKTLPALLLYTIGSLKLYDDWSDARMGETRGHARRSFFPSTKAAAFDDVDPWCASALVYSFFICGWR